MAFSKSGKADLALFENVKRVYWQDSLVRAAGFTSKWTGRLVRTNLAHFGVADHPSGLEK
jgi:hypothetical protein